jgi:hypothetical protein
MLSLRRWRPRHLLAAWLAYWAVLILVKLWPALLAAWRLSRTGSHGNANAAVGDGVLSASISQSGRIVWTGSIPFLTLILLLCLPPLALWVAWLVVTSRTNNADALRPKEQQERKELAAPDRIPGTTESFSQPSMRKRREEI